MKTIKAKDATFGRYYECERRRTRCVHTPHEGSCPVFMSRFGVACIQEPTHEITELPEECDSFDWQPAAEGSDGVRWFARPNLTGNVWCWHAKEQCGEQSCFSAPRKRIDTCYFTPEGMLANGVYEEITTAESLALIGANDWPEGVAKAKELAGIVDEVEPDAVGVMDSMMNAMGYKRCDAEATTTEANTVLTDLVSGKWKAESEEVRWYLDVDEYVNLLQGYGPSGELVVCLDSGESENGNNANEERSEKDTRLTTPEVLCRLATAGHNDAWNAARKLAGLSEREAYLAGQSACGLSVGDRVRVTRKAADREMGWDCGCLDGSDVGELMKVREVCDQSYLLDGYYHPYFVLEKIETPADEATPIETPAEVAPEIDPEPEHRLIDKSVDKLSEGDEFTFDGGATWLPSRDWKRGEDFANALIYRRRIQPAAIDYTQWQEPIGLGNDYPLPVGTVIEIEDEESGILDTAEVTSDTKTHKNISNAKWLGIRAPVWSGADCKWRVKSYPQPAADHVNKWVGGYWSLGKWVSGHPCGVEVAQ